MTFLDGRRSLTLAPRLKAQVSARLNLSLGDYGASDIARPLRLDLREAFATWAAAAFTFVDFGRVNQRVGVAYSYNPADIFRAGALVDPLTGDARVLREGRLGSGMLRVQQFWTGGQIQAIWSPRLADQGSLLRQDRRDGLELRLDRVNAADRFMLRVEQEVGGLRPEIVLFRDSEATAAAVAATYDIGPAIIVHGEAALGRRPSILGSALRFGQITGDLPAVLVGASQAGDRRHLRLDAIIGGTLVVGRWTLLAEYHRDEAGLTRRRWRDLLDAGVTPLGLLGVRYLQLHAADIGRVTSRNTAFMRVARNDLFVRRMEVSAFASQALDEGSTYLQANASYDVDDRTNLSTSVNMLVGSDTSAAERLGRSSRLVFGMRRYF